MPPRVYPSSLQSIEPLRRLFLQENNFQIRYNACHERNWSDSYVIEADNHTVGYGSLKGKDNIADRDTVFEFYIIPPWRKNATALFKALLAGANARFIECQTNDALLSARMYEFAANIVADVVLLKDHVTTALSNPGVVFRERRTDDQIFEHVLEPPGEYLLEYQGEVVATGGFMLHYNMPFSDLYMEVRKDHRRKGFGSYLLQELKRVSYLQGRVPAARCHIDNTASRAALLKAGLVVAGYMLTGEVKGVT